MACRRAVACMRICISTLPEKNSRAENPEVQQWQQIIPLMPAAPVERNDPEESEQSGVRQTSSGSREEPSSPPNLRALLLLGSALAPLSREGSSLRGWGGEGTRHRLHK